MAVSRWRTDPTTRAKLGPQVLADLQINLWNVDCQSCGGSLGRWRKPSLEVQAQDGFAAASLHHRRCRPPVWVDGTVDLSGRRHLTWRAGCFLLPPGDVPIFLVNPSYELAFLREDADGKWRLSTLEPFVALGFEYEFPSKPRPPLPSLSASINGVRISVDVQHDGLVPHAWRNVPIPADVAAVVHEWGDIMVAVTTLLDVSRPFTVEQIMVLMGAGRVALAQAPLGSVAFDSESQRLRPGEVGDGLPTRAFALAAEAIRRRWDFEVGDMVIGAALALCDGKNRLIEQLSGRDKRAAVLMVSCLFSLDSRDRSGEVARGRGVHVIAADSASADEYAEFFEAVAEEGVIGSVGRLGADPLSAEGGDAYLSDVVIGTGEEFIAAYTAYTDAGREWNLHAGRGRLAIAAGSDLKGTDLIRRYPKVAYI